MAKIDELVLSMEFDNSRFKRAASETIGVLDNLKKNLNVGSIKDAFSGSRKAVDDVNNSVKNIDLSHISQQIEQTNRQWDIMGTVGRTAIFRITNSVMDLGGKLKGLVWDPIVQGGMNRAKNLEQANFMLKGTLGDAEDAGAQVELIMDNANTAVLGTSFGLDEAAKTAAQFAASGMRGGDEMMKALRGISGAAAMTSSSYDEMSNIFTTVNGNGRLMTEQLNQMASRGLNAAATLADHFGVTEGELRKMVTEGKVQFKDFYTAMDNAYGEHATKATETYAGALSGVRSALGRIGAKVATPYLEDMRDVFNALARAIDGVSKLLDPFINIIVDHMGRASRFAVGHIQTFTTAIQGFTDPDLANPSAGWMNFFNFLQDLMKVAGLVGEVVVDAFKVMGGAAPTFIEMSDTVTSTGTKIQHIFRKVFSVLMLGPEIIGMVLQEVFGLAGGVGSLGDSFLSVVDNIAGFLYLAAEAVRESKLLQVVIRTLGTGVRIAVEAFGLLGRGVAWVVDILASLAGRFQPVIDFISNLIGKISEFWLKLLDFEFPEVDGFLDIFSNLWEMIKNFKIPKLNLGEFRGFGNLVRDIGGWLGDLSEHMFGLDFSFLANMFSGIGDWAKNFSLPKLDMDLSGMAGLRDRVSSGVSSIMSNMKVSGNFEPMFRAASFVKGIDFRGIAGGIGDGLTSAFRTSLEVVRNFGKWVGDALSNISWADVGRNIAEGITTSLEFIKDTASTIGEFLTNTISQAVDMIDFESLWDNILNFGKNVKDAAGDVLKGMTEGFREEELDTEIEVDVKVKTEGAEILESAVSGGGFFERVKSIGTAIGELFKGVGGLEIDFDSITSIFGEGIGTSLGAAASSVGSFIGFVVNPIQTSLNNAQSALTTGIQSFGTNIGDTFTTVFDTIANSIDIGQIQTFLGTLTALFTGLSVFSLARSISGLTDSLSGVAASVSGFFDSIKDSLTGFAEAAKIEAKGNTILKIAGSVAILAAAVWVLSKIPWDQMQVGLGATMALLGALLGAMVIMDKTMSDDAGEKIASISRSMMQIGIAVGILAASIWLLGRMDIETILQGLGVAILSIAALAGGVALAGLTKGLSGIGMAFIGLATGVGILAGAFFMFKMINPEEIKKGLLTIAGALLSLSIAARIADGRKLAGAGTAMLGVGAGLLALAFGIKAISNLDADQLKKGLGVLAGVMTGITLMTKFGGGQLTATVGSLIGLAGALIALAIAIRIISNIDFGTAFGGMAVLVAGLVGLGWAMRAFPKDMPAIAGSLMGIAAAMAILIGAIWVLGNMELDTVAQGVITLGVAIGGLLLALKFMPAGALGKVGALALGLITLAGAMLIFALAMRTLQDIEWGTLHKAAAIIAALLVVLGILGATGEFLGVGIGALGTGLAILGGGLLVIAASVWVFADAVSTLVDSLVSLAENGANIKNALEEAGEGITLFAEEAAEGLTALLDIVGDAGLLNVGALATLFAAFGEIPADMGPRMESLVSGLEALKPALPIIQELNDFGKQVGFGDNKSIGGFFRALGEVDPDSGAGMSSIVQGLKDIQEVLPIMAEIRELGGDVGFGDNRSIGGFFRAIGEVDPSSGEGLSSVVQGFKDIQEVIPIMAEIREFGGDVGFGDNRSVGGFFGIFSGLDAELGGNIASVASGLTQMETVIPIMQEISNFGKQIGTGDNTSIAGFFDSFAGIDPGLGETISSLSSSLHELNEVLPIIQEINNFGKQIGFGDNKSIAGFFNSLSESISSDLGSKLSEASAGIQEFSDAIPILSDAIGQLEGLDVDSLSEIVSNIEIAFSSGVGDGLMNAAESIRVAVEAMLTAATERTSEFRSAGEDLGSNLTEGVGSKEGDAKSAGEDLGNAGASGARGSRSKFVSAGEYVGAGLAVGIRRSKDEVVAAAREVAEAAAAASRAALEVESPSRVFMEIGEFVSQGFAKGILNDGPRAQAAIVDTMDAAIRVMDGKTFELKDSTKGFYDGLINHFNNNPMIRRLEELGKHSEAAYATAIKEKRIQDELDREKAEDDKERAYRDVEDAKRGVEDAERALRDAEKQELSERRTAEDHARDISDKKRAIADAEKKHRRSIAARERYEYQMHGEEAGVAFVDGVAVGIIDNSDKLPTLADIFSEVLISEFDYIKEQANDFIGVFQGMQSVKNTVKSVNDHVRELDRAMTRLLNTTSPRSMKRNAEIIFDSVIAIGSELVGLMDVVDKFKPYLPMLLTEFDKHLPAIIPIVAQFAPALASTLGGGLAAALPAIAGPAAGIIGAIFGIVLFLRDMAGDQTLLRILRKIFRGVIDFIKDLPNQLVRFVKMILRGIVNTITEIPRFFADLLVAIIEAIAELLIMLPEILPELITAIFDSIVELLTVLPVILVESAAKILVALVEGLIFGIPRLLLAIPMMFFKIGVAIVQGIIQGIIGDFKGVFNALGFVFGGIIDFVKGFLGIRSPSRVFADIGGDMMDGLGKGIGDSSTPTSAIRDAIQKIIDEMDDTPEGTITITPVIDLEPARKSMGELGDMLSETGDYTQSGYDNASQIADAESRIRDTDDQMTGGNVTNINYVQNNTSPQPLRTIDIYRGTQKQLQLMR